MEIKNFTTEDMNQMQKYLVTKAINSMDDDSFINYYNEWIQGQRYCEDFTIHHMDKFNAKELKEAFKHWDSQDYSIKDLLNGECEGFNLDDKYYQFDGINLLSFDDLDFLKASVIDDWMECFTLESLVKDYISK